MVDAIVRTLYRKLISRRKLLEWVTAAQAESTARHDLASFLRFMFPAEVLALVAVLLTWFVHPASLYYMAPVSGGLGRVSGCGVLGQPADRSTVQNHGRR